MKKLLFPSLFFVYIILFMSCEKIIDSSIAETQRKLVINAVATPGQELVVSLTKSKSIVSNEQNLNVSDADISLFEDGILLEKVSNQASGEYLFSTKLKENKTYKLIASNGVYPSVQAEVYMPKPVKIKKIETKNISYEGSSFSILFDDPAGVHNYYLLTISGLSEYFDINTGVNTIMQVPYSYEIELMQGQKNTYPYFTRNELSGFVFSDIFFDGYSYSLNVTSFIYQYEPGKPQSIHFLLTSISESYYNYIISRDLYLQNKGNPFSQPVQVYTNITNGIGIFGAYSTSVDSVSISF